MKIRNIFIKILVVIFSFFTVSCVFRNNPNNSSNPSQRIYLGTASRVIFLEKIDSDVYRAKKKLLLSCEKQNYYENLSNLKKICNHYLNILSFDKNPILKNDDFARELVFQLKQIPKCP